VWVHSAADTVDGTFSGIKNWWSSLTDVHKLVRIWT
jgi:hypothetical protein